MAARISAIVISRNERARLRQTVLNLADTLPAEAEILVIDDASTDGSADFLKRHKTRRLRLIRNTESAGVARCRNQGARQASGEVLIFCDAHISLEPDWHRPLLGLVENPRIAAAAPAMKDTADQHLTGYGLTLPKPNLHAIWRHRRPAQPVPAPIVPGACVAMRRDAFESVEGFDEGMLAAGSVDNEMCLRLWTFGYEAWITPQTLVRHHFRDRAPYSLPAAFTVHNRLRLAMTHFSPNRLDRAVKALQKYQGFAEALLMVANTNVVARRTWVLQRRLRKDDWFFDRFRLCW